ncbi:F0F1 ATP synthase subunit delta, partial [Xanthomonas hortorum]
MSQALTLARPYGRAAFAIAREGGTFALWSDALAFSAQVAGDPRVAALLLNPALRQEQAVTLLAPPTASEDYLRFLGLLADAQRLSVLPEIAGLYEQLRAEAEHVVKATVTSATEMTATELDTI